MGIKMAPSYVNLVLAYLEENMYTEVGNIYGKEYSTHIKHILLDTWMTVSLSGAMHGTLINSIHSWIINIQR